MVPPEKLCLLIADISGYTEYLAGVEIEHAQDILADLVGTVVEKILDWRPFDYATTRSTMPPSVGGVRFVSMCELEPTPAGNTIVRFRIEKPRKAADRKLLEQLAEPMGERYAKAIEEMRVEVVGEAAARSAGRIEPKLPRATNRDGFLADIQPIEIIG